MAEQRRRILPTSLLRHLVRPASALIRHAGAIRTAGLLVVETAGLVAIVYGVDLVNRPGAWCLAGVMAVAAVEMRPVRRAAPKGQART